MSNTIDFLIAFTVIKGFIISSIEYNNLNDGIAIIINIIPRYYCPYYF